MKRTAGFSVLISLALFSTTSYAQDAQYDEIPNPRLDGLPVNACATNATFLVADHEACGKNARRMIANYFCRKNGYDWGGGATQKLTEPQLTQKLLLEVAVSRGVHELKTKFVNEPGDLIFNHIYCFKGGMD